MRTTQTLLGGLAGAALLTATHETLRHTVARAPRMDLLGMQVVRKVLSKAGAKQPGSHRLFLYTMAGDLVANTIYYSLGGVRAKNPVARGLLLGIAAGVGAVLLPRPMGLDDRPAARTTATMLMTIGLYTLGGLAAGLVRTALQKTRRPKTPATGLVL